MLWSVICSSILMAAASRSCEMSLMNGTTHTGVGTQTLVSGIQPVPCSKLFGRVAWKRTDNWVYHWRIFSSHFSTSNLQKTEKGWGVRGGSKHRNREREKGITEGYGGREGEDWRVIKGGQKAKEGMGHRDGVWHVSRFGGVCVKEQ